MAHDVLPSCFLAPSAVSALSTTISESVDDVVMQLVEFKSTSAESRQNCPGI